MQVSHTGREEQFIETSIQLPVVIPAELTVTAFESGCPILEFGGKIEIDPDEDGPIIIPIELSPLQMVFGMRSEQDRVSLGDTYVLDIYVQNAFRLVGFACELDFKEDLLEPSEIERGDRLAEKLDLLSIWDPVWDPIDTSRPEGRISLGFTGNAETGGICGSGSLFRITFLTKGIEENANVSILEESLEVLILVDGHFEEANPELELEAVVKITE